MKKAVHDDKLCQKISEMLSSRGIKIDYQILESNYLNLLEGFDCEILQQSGGGWKKGKFKIKLILETWDDEEKPEKSESPLDDIRRSL